MRRRDLMGGLGLALLPGTGQAQRVLCGPGQPEFVTNPGPCEPASLDLTFMVPGSLDPRIAFTRASTGTYFDSAGVMRNAATNAPRWDYDPVTLQLRGLLLEDARTNLVWPSVIGGVRWTANGLALGGSVTTPDGVASTTALLAAIDTSNSARTIDNSGNTITASTPYTMSVYFKRNATNAFIQVLTTGGTTAASVAYFDLTAGTGLVGADLIAGHTNKSVSINPAGNGWYRATFTLTSMAGNTGLNVYFGPCTTVSATGDNRSYVGVVGQGVYAWGAQVEAGAFATSYIPTTSAAVTRAADNLQILPANMAPWFVPPGGSWFAEFIDSDPTGTKNPRIVAQAAAGGVTQLWEAASSRVLAQYDGAGPNTLNAITTNAVMRGVSSFGAGVGKVCLNGGNIGQSAMSTGYAACVGSGIAFLATTRATLNECMTGYLRAVRYYARVLTDAEMQSITR